MATAITTSMSSSQNKSLQNQDPASDSLKAAIFQRLHPRVYLERFLAEDVRPDGRALGTMEKDGDSGIWRDVSINVGTSVERGILSSSVWSMSRIASVVLPRLTSVPAY